MTGPKSLHDQAEAYLRLGWRLVRIPLGSKGPQTPGWNEPSNVIDSSIKLRMALQSGPCNLGLVHEYSRTVSIDVDDVEATRIVFAALELDYDQLMAHGLRIRSRPGRDKVILCNAPIDLPMVKLTWPDREHPNDQKKRKVVFELRSGRNQDVLPPSVHPDTQQPYEWVSTPPWARAALPGVPDQVLRLWRALADPKNNAWLQGLCPWAPEVKEDEPPPMKARASNREHDDVIGQFNATTDVRALLEDHQYKRKGSRWLAPSSTSKLPGVLVKDNKAYSFHQSDVLADGHSHDAFDVFTTLEWGGNFEPALAHARRLVGAEQATIAPQMDIAACRAASAARRPADPPPTPPSTPAPTVVEVSTTPAVFAVPEPRTPEEDDEEDEEDPAALTASMLPDHVLARPPGMLGLLVEWIVGTAPRPQRELALATALAIAGNMLGRRVAGPTGLRTNLLIGLLAGSGHGKEHLLQCAEAACRSWEPRPEAIVNDVASGPALLSALHASPNLLWTLDEMGGTLVGWKGDRAPPHLQQLGTTLLKVATAENKPALQGAVRADRRMNPTQSIAYPHLTLLGATTHATLWPALSGADLASGFLNRFLFISAPEARPAYNKAIARVECPPELKQWFLAVQLGTDGIADGTKGEHKDHAEHPHRLAYHPLAERALDDLRDRADERGDKLRKVDGADGLEKLWSRAHAHALKIAAIATCALHPEGLPAELDPTATAWAVAFVEATVGYMASQASENIGDSEAAKVADKALRHIVRGGQSGVTMARLLNNCRPLANFASNNRGGLDHVLGYLQMRELVKMVREGATIVRYVATPLGVAFARRAM